nr:hephaestin-like protein [Lytechinus pictus]
MADRPEWLGFLGPLIYGEVGDTIKIHAKNMATREFSVHPHGVFYLKDSEGAVYEDNTRGKDKADERIAPGGSHTYTWEANERAGPAEGGPNCVPWIYHSHIDTPFGTNSGAIGFMLICRKGILDENNRRTDVEEDFILMFTVTDENMSYYFDENIQRFITSPSLDPEDEDFLASNRMDSVNGYLYGAMPGLNICHGDKVAWHIMGIGTEIDVHTVNFHGNVLELRNHRVDTLSLTPAVVSSADMVAINPGTWLAKSHVVNHQTAGAQVLYTVDPDCGPGVTEEPLTGSVREYFIGVLEDEWHYGPTAINGLDGRDLTDPESMSFPFFTDTNNRIPGTYHKARYVQYSDDTFTPDALIDRSPEDRHMGVLGPVIRGEVGDTIRVTFKNTGRVPYSIHPRGVLYDKANEGSIYNDNTDASEQNDGSVAPSATYTYTWTIPPSIGPTELDEDCLTMVYTSGTDETMDLYSGLVGPMLICKEGTLNDDGSRVGVDRELFLLFLIFDENQSWYLEENIAAFAPGADREDEDFVASNLMTSINGYSFANLPEVEMTAGETVSWHVMDLGKDTDQHTAYFHQLTFVLEGRRVDAVPLFPGVTQTIMTVPDNPGKWLIECETNTHFSHGMTALYTVLEGSESRSDGAVSDSGMVREYFIAAIEMEWDYTPDMYDPVRSQALTDEESPGYVFVNRGNTSIGSKYRKAIYREYEDDRFIKQVKRTSNEDKSLGILGPVLRVEVGDTLRVVFRNLATRPYSIHPQNLLSDKDNEGATYGDRSTSDLPVLPGETKTYTWTVPESRAPTESDGACTASIYYSSIHRGKDTNAGLVGPLVICKTGSLDSEGKRTDVDKEFNLFFSVTDENKSWYLQENIDHYCLTPSAVDVDDPDFQESNLMHGMNGFLYNNLNYLEMSVGERVGWNLLGLGDEVDLHSVHFHGHTFTYQTEHTNRLDVSELFPGIFINLVMTLDDPGIWLIHCHVNDHMTAGMEAFYYVNEAPVPTTEATGSTCIISSSLVIMGMLLIISLYFQRC